MRERKGGKVGGKKLFNIVCKCTQKRSDTQRGCKSPVGKKFGELDKKSGIGQHGHKFWLQVHESDQLSLPSTHHSFVASGRCVKPDAPAGLVDRVKLLETEGDTHTHTRPLCGALAQSLNRHLKSLRNKRRKPERAALKGQERKIGVAKSEYLALDWGRETSLKNHLKSLKESPRK